MDQAIALRWADRLESGTVEQTKDVLGRKSGERCCLGVLCDIAVEDGVIGLPSARGDGVLLYQGRECWLPAGVVEWAGMASSNGHYQGGGTLAGLNDGGVTFGDIAVVIRKHWKSL